LRGRRLKTITPSVSPSVKDAIVEPVLQAGKEGILDRLGALESRINLMNSDISLLNNKVSKLRLVDFGKVDIPNATRRVEGGFRTVLSKSVPFNTRDFASPPEVFLILERIEYYNGGERGTFFQLHAQDVSTAGFGLNVEAAHASSFSSATVKWIAIGRSK
jgi:hypothetical protein